MTQTFFIHKVGTRISRVVLWGVCPDAGVHCAEFTVGKWTGDNHRHQAEVIMGQLEIEDGWNGSCEKCGAPVDWRVATAGKNGISASSLMMSTIWDSPNGTNRIPGAMYYADWSRDSDGEHWCHGGWTNCDGKHLTVVCPNGHTWDIDSRASNCGSPDDTVHRCWIRHGDPETEPVTVDKNGLTCVAGGGSIQAGDFHGFLRDGVIA